LPSTEEKPLKDNKNSFDQLETLNRMADNQRSKAEYDGKATSATIGGGITGRLTQLSGSWHTAVIAIKQKAFTV